jgi:putative ABC transport system permease protein
MSTRWLKGLLFGIKPSDHAHMFAVCTVLGIVAVFAGYVPTRRAVRVDPAVALRTE